MKKIEQSTQKGRIEATTGITAALAMVISWGLTHYFKIQDGEQLSIGLAALVLAGGQWLVGRHNIARDETQEGK